MEIPVSLRRWFVAHFGVNLLIGAPLLLVPEGFLRAIGWQTVDGSSARLAGSALLAVGVQSLLTRNAGVGTLRMMLNFNLVWSWAIIAGLVFAAADNAPDPVWALLAFFLPMSSVWFHYRMQLDGEGEDEEVQEALPAGGDELSELLHLEATTGVPERVHPGTSFDSVSEDDVKALFASKAAEEAKAKAEQEAREAEAYATAAAAELEEAAPNRTLQGMSPEKRAELDELESLMAASASTGIDDKKAERLANLLAARKAARANGEPPAEVPLFGDESEAAPAAEDALAGDDIAAMLANGPEEKTLGSDDIAAMLADGPEEKTMGSDDIAAMLAQDDADAAAGAGGPGESPLASDDIAAMLAEGDTAAPEEKTLGSDDIAAMLAGDEDGMSSEDLALMLAGNEGGSPEPPPSPPTLRGRAEPIIEDIDPDDDSILFTDDTPPPEPTAVLADAAPEGSPGDTMDEAADEDAIAALLAASRGDTA